MTGTRKARARRAAGRRCYTVEADEVGIEVLLGELGYAVSDHAQTRQAGGRGASFFDFLSPLSEDTDWNG
jgi:hypothetical protein